LCFVTEKGSTNCLVLSLTGPYCNHYFLKRLAAIGRGMNDVAFRPHAIQSVMERMLAAAALPMLSDVQIRVQVGLEHLLCCACVT
jgi:hypothetical protein